MTPSSHRPRRIVSGIQPTGKLHLGNYFGAVRQHIGLQEQAECFFFIADYHSMTTVSDAALRRENVRDVALDYLALGLDPQRALLFRQSDVPEVCELAWMFSTVTPMSWMEKMVSYKDKIARGIEPTVGLFTYPILMGADILIYRSNVVPVGEDQVQHIEITRDIADRFNRVYQTDLFPLPVPQLPEAGGKVPGIDGQKMSKTYRNTIEIFAEGNALKKPVMSIPTDSKTVEEPKDPESNTIYQLYRLFATPEEQAALAERFRAGGLGYGEAKKALFEKIDAHFAPFRDRRRQLAADPATVEEILRAGARKAREEARQTMDAVRAATGFGPSP